MKSPQEHIITLPDGRRVGAADYGKPGHTAVLWAHGGPSCRHEPAPLSDAAVRSGLRIIGVDRPGYGRSTMQPGRTIGGWVGDALAVADHLGLERFATVGVSTGGAYALALAASSARVIASVACCAVTDMRFAEGKATLAWGKDIWAAPSRADALAVAEQELGHGGRKAARLDGVPLAPTDLSLLADPKWAETWSAAVPEIFAQGVGGYTDDRIADGRGWHTFDVARIKCPVAVLHGTSDTMVPVALAHHTQRIVPGATLELREGLGHFSILPEVVPVLSALLERSAAPCASRQRAG
jgi:pimeloyl-ACP methyl ester carboxylesterase